VIAWYDASVRRAQREQQRAVGGDRHQRGDEAVADAGLIALVSLGANASSYGVGLLLWRAA
jgi:hypothetical protein